MSHRATLASPRSRARRLAPPTVWGLTPARLHDRFWAAYGVQIVRRGHPVPIEPRAEIYLLCEPETLVLLELREALKVYAWLEPMLLRVRVQSPTPGRYREVVLADSQDRVVRVQRVYGDTQRALSRVALTTNPELAERWSKGYSGPGAWRRLKADVPRDRRAAVRVEGQTFDITQPRDSARFVKQLVEAWPRPDRTIAGATAAGKAVWVDPAASLQSGARLLGPVWVGAGREVPTDACVVGPTVLWDAPGAAAAPPPLDWSSIRLSKAPRLPEHALGAGRRPIPGKRAFDIAFALAVLLMTAPLFPIIALAILIEDGRPIFFGHRRETLGAKEFSCWKFRSMRNDAEDIKAQLQAENEADGPQFFMDPAKDPRLTAVGKFIRKTQLDELPQFANVLLGHMSVVGPRPSPRRENQYCPGWRESRLSMRPGLTGMWQVKRTRAPGLDFQEWIRFDLLYAESRSWALDLSIIWMTIKMVMPWEQLRWWRARKASPAGAEDEARRAALEESA